MVASVHSRNGRNEGVCTNSTTTNNYNGLRQDASQDQSNNQSVLPEETIPASSASVSWMSLPNKKQLMVLIMARLSEPLVQTSMQSYMFYQLKSFDRSLPDSVIAGQAGVMQASFKAGQMMTALVFGIMADSERVGRKYTIIIGLFGTCISCIGFGFSTSFWQALAFRTFGGALNGNVAVMRTVISELIKEKKKPKAFLLLPMCFNVGSIIGPLLGGVLADPAKSYPDLFGNVQWMVKFPYALPNLVNGCFLLYSASLVLFGLDETLELLRHKEDYGRLCSRKITETVSNVYRRIRTTEKYAAESRLGNTDESQSLLRDVNGRIEHPTASSPESRPKPVPRYTQKLPFRRIFTTNVINTLTASAIIGIYMGAFNPLWLIFLSTSVADPSNGKQHPPFFISGGLGMPPRDVGFAMAILGTIGLFIQLFIYPAVTHRIGTIRCWRISLYCFPIAAVLVPFLALIPSQTPPPAGKDGPLVWLAVSAVLIVQVVGRVFVGPATSILVNNCTPHPSALAKMHSIAAMVASGVRTVAPILAGWFYGISLDYSMVSAVWWGLALIALYGCVASNWVKEGNGHEIWLEGDDDLGEE